MTKSLPDDDNLDRVRGRGVSDVVTPPLGAPIRPTQPSKAEVLRPHPTNPKIKIDKDGRYRTEGWA